MDSRPHMTNEKEAPLPGGVNSVLYDAEAAQALELKWRHQARRRRFIFHFLGFASLLYLWFIGRQYFAAQNKYDGASICMVPFGCGGGWQDARTAIRHPRPPHHCPGRDRGPVPLPPGIIIGECTDWNRDSPSNSNLTHPGNHYSAFAEFPLSVDSELFIISRGSFSFGLFKIVQSTERISTDAKAIVEIKYEQERFLDLAKVCKVTRVDEDEKDVVGVGIFTPHWPGRGPHRHHHPWFDVTLELPKAKSKDDKEAPLKISSLSTDMPIFRHSIEGLKTVSFGNLNLATANTEVISEDVWADNITIHTSNSPIRGTYRAWSSINLRTDNAPIDVSLELQNLNSTNVTYASLITTNSLIESRTNLSTTDTNPGGNFSVFASTVNGRIGLSFPEAPVNSALDAKAVTILGPVDVSLHPTFQGTFAMKTLFAPAQVVQSKSKVEDPEGKNRTRVVDVRNVSGGQLNGEVYWDEEKKSAGSVVMDSTLAPLNLFI